MKIAIVGSRYRNISFSQIREHLPEETRMIISGEAKGVDTCARRYAKAYKIPFDPYPPDYKKYPPKVAPHKRNDIMIHKADLVLIFWDGRIQNCGSYSVIEKCIDRNKPHKVIPI